ncbi:hypothetical protein EVAR_71033_1 [Eumeta japonica]|uniref:Secreted protein n=1 Tax=Eumeta variegata TaxID=151549 RepID=A0A4C2A1F2_EUMVA|nr:hypothetical protein EVAR_71033_1 [Eumeta japonica]
MGLYALRSLGCVSSWVCVSVVADARGCGCRCLRVDACTTSVGARTYGGLDVRLLCDIGPPAFLGSARGVVELSANILSLNAESSKFALEMTHLLFSHPSIQTIDAGTF